MYARSDAPRESARGRAAGCGALCGGSTVTAQTAAAEGRGGALSTR